MRIGDEDVVARTVRERRARRGLSQADLAEIARVSTKTIQRIEAGHAVAPGTRRAVLESLRIDPERVAAADGGPRPEVTDWIDVGDGAALLKTLAFAESVDIELDRAAWDEEVRNRPWYRQGIFFATRDPIEMILEIVDGASAWRDLPAGRRAKRQGELAEAIRAARTINWALAFRVDDAGSARLYIGAPSIAARRCAGPSGPAAGEQGCA